MVNTVLLDLVVLMSLLSVFCSVVIKDLIVKAKAKDLIAKAKAKAKDLDR